jgi:hypothetical protein
VKPRHFLGVRLAVRPTIGASGDATMPFDATVTAAVLPDKLLMTFNPLFLDLVAHSPRKASKYLDDQVMRRQDS